MYMHLLHDQLSTIPCMLDVTHTVCRGTAANANVRSRVGVLVES